MDHHINRRHYPILVNAGRHRGSIAAWLIVFALSACTDQNISGPTDTSAINRTDLQEAGVVDREDGDIQSIDRFSVDVRAVGPLQPGKPVQLLVSIRANLPTKEAEIRIVAPEVEVAQMSNWAPNFRVPVEKSVEAKGSWRAALGFV